MNLEGVEKTMLLTLYAKAKHSQQKNHKFYDSKAIEIISKIDYDFSIAERTNSCNLEQSQEQSYWMKWLENILMFTQTAPS